MVVGELGNREVKVERMFDLGDSCPLPTCDGEIVEGQSARNRHCSNGCLEWVRNVPADGDPCPQYDCEDGEAIIEIDRNGKYTKKCTGCSVHGFGTTRWREAWWPQSKQEALDHLDCTKNDNETDDISTTDNDQTASDP